MLPRLTQRLSPRERPRTGPVMFQRWSHLLFLHWRWDPAEIQATLPPGLWVDTFENNAYLGIVPFWMDRVRPRFLPPVPGLSWFMELNLRTYVYTEDGTPGVWFYSLDCNNPIAVRLARGLFSLPYVDARQRGQRPRGDTDATCFESRRSAAGAALNRFIYTPRPGYAFAAAAPGSLEFFLVERYLLFSRHRTGTLRVGNVWHPPYAIAPADVTCAETSLFTDNGFVPPTRPADHQVVSRGVDVRIFPLRRIGRDPG